MSTTVDTRLTSHQLLTLVRSTFTGQEDQRISLTQAAELTSNFRAMGALGGIKGGYFGGAIVERILAQKEAIGVRVYFARHHGGEPTFVLTGVEESGNDLYEGVLAQHTLLCPPYCSATNPLNSDTTILSRRREPLRMFTGFESHYVSLAEASDLIQDQGGLAAGSGVKGCYFSRRTLSDILGQPRLVGIRFYFAAEATGMLSLVATGVEQDGTDLARGILGRGQSFGPLECGTSNALNR